MDNMASSGMDERSPLLSSENCPSTINYGQAIEHVIVSPISPQELPPPSLSSENGIPVITCQVCTAAIELTGKQEQYVVKCNNCNEATPIKTPPPGKKYVRCPCNCLLICKTSSQKISCPRPNCKKIIQLAQISASSATNNIPGMARVSCGHCENMFLFNTLNNALARCPHCRKLSTVGVNFARCRVLIYVALSLIFLVVAIIITVSIKYEGKYGIWIAIYAACYVLFCVFFGRALYYYTMKVSTVLSFS